MAASKKIYKINVWMGLRDVCVIPFMFLKSLMSMYEFLGASAVMLTPLKTTGIVL